MSDTPDTSAPPPEPPPPRRFGQAVLSAGVLLALVIGAVAATPLWAPAMMQLLPWGSAPLKPPPPAAPDPSLATLKLQAAQTAAALQELNKEVAALAARPAPDLAPLQQQVAALVAKPSTDLAPLQQQVTALSASVADLAQKIAAVDKAAQSASQDTGTALALVLLEIREAVEVGRPFDAECQALVALARDSADVAAAAAPLAGPAVSGVASRAVLASRLHELAPQITGAATEPKPGWRSQIVARLRSLVTVRRVDGEGQSPAEQAVSTAERALAASDLDGAIGALAGLGGANLAAAQPWLAMARQRFEVETALHRIGTLLAASLGGATATAPKPG